MLKFFSNFLQHSTAQHSTAQHSKMSKIFASHNQILQIAFSPTQQQFASSSNETGDVQVWDTNHRKCIKTINTHDRAVSLKYCTQGCCLAYGTSYGGIFVYDASTWQHIKYKSSTNRCRVLCLAFSQNGKYLASVGSQYNEIRVVNVAKRSIHCSLIGHENIRDCLQALHFIDDENLLSFANDNQCIQWNVEKKEKVLQLTGFHNHAGEASFSNNGNFLVAQTGLTEISVWNLKSATQKKISTHIVIGSQQNFLPNDDIVTSVCFMCNNTHLLYSTTLHGIYLWNIAENICVRTFQKPNRDIKDFTKYMLTIGVHPSEKYFAAETLDSTIVLHKLLDKRYIVLIAQLLHRCGITSYIILDIINFVFANQHRINLVAESMFQHYDKVLTIKMC